MRKRSEGRKDWHKPLLCNPEFLAGLEISVPSSTRTAGELKVSAAITKCSSQCCILSLLYISWSIGSQTVGWRSSRGTFPVSAKTVNLIEEFSESSLVFAWHLGLEDEFWTCTLITSHRISLAVEWSCGTEILWIKTRSMYVCLFWVGSLELHVVSGHRLAGKVSIPFNMFGYLSGLNLRLQGREKSHSL